MSTNNITDLETLILNTIDDLKDNPNCNIPQARAISSLAGQALRIQLVKIAAARLSGNKPNLPFMDDGKTIEGKVATRRIANKPRQRGKAV